MIRFDGSGVWPRLLRRYPKMLAMRIQAIIARHAEQVLFIAIDERLLLELKYGARDYVFAAAVVPFFRFAANDKKDSRIDLVLANVGSKRIGAGGSD